MAEVHCFEVAPGAMSLLRARHWRPAPTYLPPPTRNSLALQCHAQACSLEACAAWVRLRCWASRMCWWVSVACLHTLHVRAAATPINVQMKAQRRRKPCNKPYYGSSQA